jgi:hypothetical protein
MSGILLATVGNSYGSAPVNTVAPRLQRQTERGQVRQRRHSPTNGLEVQVHLLVAQLQTLTC